MNLKDSKISTPCNTKERGRCWGLTINNYTDDDVANLEALKPKLKKYSWQSEVGKKGTEHLQVALWFVNQKTFSSIKNVFKTAHIEKAKNWTALSRYCSKADTHDGKIRECREDRKFVVTTSDPMLNKKLFKWQIKILDLLKEKPDDRSIHWFWEPNGGVGKTTFVKSLVIKNNDYIYISGAVADIKYGIFKFIESKGRGPKTIFMNIPRCVEHISYNALEQVKDGIFYNTKYESDMVVFDNPHVIIFANEPPDFGKMSKDRWNVVQIKHPSKGSLRSKSLCQAADGDTFGVFSPPLTGGEEKKT